MILPFEQENYQQDFQGEALAHFKRLVAQAKSNIVLTNPRRLPPEQDDAPARKAYEAAGLTVIGNCDVVLSVWDGGELGGRGGTTEILEAAAGAGIPIIHIDATGTNPTLIRWSGLDELPVEAETPDALPARPFDDALPGLIDKLARPPVEAAERKGPVRYLKQRFRACNPFFAFPLLMTALLVRVFKMTDVFPNRPDALLGNSHCGACGRQRSVSAQSR